MIEKDSMAQDCAGSGCYHIADLRCKLFIQVKAEFVAPRSHDCLRLFSQSLVLREPLSFLPTFAIKYTLILFGHLNPPPSSFNVTEQIVLTRAHLHTLRKVRSQMCTVAIITCLAYTPAHSLVIKTRCESPGRVLPI